MLEADPEDETPFPHKEITEAIIGSAFEVLITLAMVFWSAYISGPFSWNCCGVAFGQSWKDESLFATRMRSLANTMPTYL